MLDQKLVRSRLSEHNEWCLGVCNPSSWPRTRNPRTLEALTASTVRHRRENGTRGTSLAVGTKEETQNLLLQGSISSSRTPGVAILDCLQPLPSPRGTWSCDPRLPPAFALIGKRERADPVSPSQSKTKAELALLALKQDANLSLQRAAAIYNVHQSTLSRRRAGQPSRADSMPSRRYLDEREEEAIVDHVLYLIQRGAAPRLSDVADMANILREERRIAPVRRDWPNNFVKRQLRLKVKFNCKYDYKRALSKYSIIDKDTYNFDKTSFAIGQITPRAVVADAETPGRAKQVQLGSKE
ncbi:hypothetical protein OPT61_g8642 [Boeremia exigua]|uniref:Uncharacterized protein n=1 Tax=Boeremia exigua TaxID=749465 RepID=A0ACC2HYA1_9PLEO|nr:hypothetical protein OPT61_g8642 [Boeremia exigua]